MSETWRPVPGFEGSYEASDRGRIRSLDRKVHYRGDVYRSVRGTTLKPSTHPKGHKMVQFGRSGTKKVHRVIAETFLPNPDNLPIVRHWDDNPANNALSNLVWGTQSYNENDKVRNGHHHHAMKTHCPQGHSYDEENTYVIPSRPNARYCRTCKRQRAKALDIEATMGVAA